MPTTYVPDASTPSGWRATWEKPIPQFIPEMVDDVPTGNLTPSISRMPDGRPVARTPEEVAQLHEIEAAEPPTVNDKVREFQISSAGLKKNDAGRYVSEPRDKADAELRAGYELAGRLSTGAITPRPEPVTLEEQEWRVREARKLAARLGYGLSAQLIGHDVAGLAGPSGLKFVLAVFLLNANGSVAWGPMSLQDCEVRLLLEAREKAARDQQQQLLRAYELRQRAELQRKLANSPEGKLHALEMEVAALTGRAPRPDYRQPMPGVPMAIVGATLNDEPVPMPAVPND